MIPTNKEWAGIAHETHEYMGYFLISCVLLHITGALKHHMIDRDGTLRRMLGQRI